MNLKLASIAGLIALSPITAHANGDWYLINQTTFTCFDVTKSQAPYHNPEEYLAWAHTAKDWLTNIKVMPNVPVGNWVEIEVFTDDNEEKDLGSVDW